MGNEDFRSSLIRGPHLLLLPILYHLCHFLLLQLLKQSTTYFCCNLASYLPPLPHRRYTV